jgi:uncharacterized protein
MSSLEIHTFSQAAPFLERVRLYLEAQEAFYNLMLGLALRLREAPDWYHSTPYLAAIESSSGEVLLAALMTPPYEIILAGNNEAEPDVFDALAESLAFHGVNPVGVNAPNALADGFALAWSQARDLEYRVRTRERAFELRRVNPVRYSPGKLRPAHAAELDLMHAWRIAFIDEALPVGPYPDQDNTARQIASGNVFVWDDGKPVSMAIPGRDTPHGISIGGVYTPPEERQKGYATSCVAALSQRLLDNGKQFVTLFTDLANPTSNDIYQQIGYVALGDYTVYRFEESTII